MRTPFSTIYPLANAVAPAIAIDAGTHSAVAMAATPPTNATKDAV